jgi:hypothetical protein
MLPSELRLGEPETDGIILSFRRRFLTNLNIIRQEKGLQSVMSSPMADGVHVYRGELFSTYLRGEV